jgi:GTP-binding protein EngB required for normal cell division
MKNLLIFFTVLFSLIFLTSCQTVSNKIDKKTTEEQRELSKWLNQPESELKIVFGKPDRIDFKNKSKNRYYVYLSEKLKIKCERKFEIDSNNMIIGFSSKNCF